MQFGKRGYFYNTVFLLRDIDVQLTKDHVPVIYHDFLVSETGIDAPVHTLTLEQVCYPCGLLSVFLLISFKFLHLSNFTTKQSDLPFRGTANGAPRQRSLSVGGVESDASELSEKMKHTRDFKTKGYKGNTRGNHIQAPFATLEDLFKKLPESVSFNIEMSKSL
jgi:glycerophosphodiester phosphodiesterase